MAADREVPFRELRQSPVGDRGPAPATAGRALTGDCHGLGQRLVRPVDLNMSGRQSAAHVLDVLVADEGLGAELVGG